MCTVVFQTFVFFVFFLNINMFVQTLPPFWNDINPKTVTINIPEPKIDALLPFPASMLQVLAAASAEAMSFGARPLPNEYSYSTDTSTFYYPMHSATRFSTHMQPNQHQHTVERDLDINTRHQSVAPFSNQRVHAFQPFNAFYSFTPHAMAPV